MSFSTSACPCREWARKERCMPLFTLRRDCVKRDLTGPLFRFIQLFNKNHLDELQGSIEPLHPPIECVKPSHTPSQLSSKLLTTNFCNHSQFRDQLGSTQMIVKCCCSSIIYISRELVEDNFKCETELIESHGICFPSYFQVIQHEKKASVMCK